MFYHDVHGDRLFDGQIAFRPILPLSVHLTVTEMETENRDGTCKWTLGLLEISFRVTEKEIFPQNKNAFQ